MPLILHLLEKVGGPVLRKVIHNDQRERVVSIPGKILEKNLIHRQLTMNGDNEIQQNFRISFIWYYQVFYQINDLRQIKLIKFLNKNLLVSEQGSNLKVTHASLSASKNFLSSRAN